MTGGQARKLVERNRQHERQRQRKDAWAMARWFVHCCGQWYPVLSLRMALPCCGRKSYVTIKRSDLHIGCINSEQLVAHGVVKEETRLGE